MHLKSLSPSICQCLSDEAFNGVCTLLPLIFEYVTTDQQIYEKFLDAKKIITFELIHKSIKAQRILWT